MSEPREAGNSGVATAKPVGASSRRGHVNVTRKGVQRLCTVVGHDDNPSGIDVNDEVSSAATTLDALRAGQLNPHTRAEESARDRLAQVLGKHGGEAWEECRAAMLENSAAGE